jgi:hypothetical protein
MKTLFSNSLYAFELSDDAHVLSFRWTERTAEMSEDDFKEALSNDAGFALEHRVPGLLVDTGHFRYAKPTPDAWRDAHVLPRYLKAGSLRMAYVVPAAMLPHTPGELRGALHEKFFGDEAAALAWLSAQ